MARDSRLSRMLHVLLHIDQAERGLTSDEIGRMLDTNPVVIRRTMAGLREQGYVTSEKGHGGGWKLARPLGEFTLLDVYAAIGEPPIFALGLAEDHAQCLVEQAVNARLDDALGQARQLLLDQFAKVTLADLSADFHARLAAHGERRCNAHREER
ncbi:Rrf2 family transcriptional regulator [Labrys portucalensis]|uniref:Rrf2 family transcriptional regulator n=1 Tax=Labrys neptuniae TaxID=376174 RepID=A0ABV6ZH57_9HYPH